MIVAILQLFAINTIDMYSSGVTLQAIGIPLKRWGCILIDTVVSGVVTGLVIFKGNLYTDLSGFLDYILVWLGAWFAILMVDYFLRRGAVRRRGSGAEDRRAVLAQRRRQLEGDHRPGRGHVRRADVDRRPLLHPVVSGPDLQRHRGR